MKINFTIKRPPVGKARSRVTRMVTYTPVKMTRYEDLARYTTVNSFRRIFDKNEPLDVKIIVYFEVPKSLSKKREVLCLDNRELPTKKSDADSVGEIIMGGINSETERDKRPHKMVGVMRGVYYNDRQITTLLAKKKCTKCVRADMRIKRDMGN